MKDLKQLKREYSEAGIDKDSVYPDPIAQFALWFGQAVDSGIAEPNGFSLCTVSVERRPAQRTVLMKSYDDSGFVFYTNHDSLKGQQMMGNNRVSMLFPWYELHRQINIEGQVSRIDDDQSYAYFHSRHRASQISAWASHQSKIIDSRSFLEKQFETLERKFQDQAIPLPPFWGGYRIKPDRFEFWQGRTHRLHDRIVYCKDRGQWKISRLSP